MVVQTVSVAAPGSLPDCVGEGATGWAGQGLLLQHPYAMKSKLVACLAVVLCTVSLATFAERPRGPIPADQQDLIRLMAGQHESMTRVVTEMPDGYLATTTSTDPAIVEALRDHLRYMKARVEAGGRVRGWDPAFREMFGHHRDLRTEAREVDGGIEVRVRGLTPDAIEVARNHGRVVSRFVAEGQAAVQRPHPVALPGSEQSQNLSEAP